MDISIRRSIISGKFTPPPSPAFAHRALFACSLALGQSVISNFPHTPETISSISACNSFGADILAKDGVADIFGAEELNFPNHIDCGQSNTTLKLLLPIACLSEKQVSLSGSGRLASCNP
ncbi:MAG: hypothetical protein QW275_00820, partial [Candidatus Anstonellaceae archaeon]